MYNSRSKFTTSTNILMGVIVLSLMAIFLGFSIRAQANATFIASNCIVQTSAVATSTLSYVNATTTANMNGTTTLAYDSYCSGNNQVTDQASLLVYMTASSTNSVVDINVEYSNGSNCIASPTLCDWYQNRLDAMVSTTTAPISLQPVSTFSWQYASSTPGKGALPATQNYDTRIISLYSPLRYLRVIFTARNPASAASGSGNSGIWAQIIPAKEKLNN